MPLKVLLIESEPTSSFSIQPDLLERGDQVVVTHSPLKAASMAMSDWPDLVVLNACAGLLNLDEVCRALDETRLDFPVLSSHATNHTTTCRETPIFLYLSIHVNSRSASKRPWVTRTTASIG